MFVAVNEHGERHNVLHVWGKEQLLALRDEERFFCPVCSAEVQLKIGERKKSHFAHKRTEGCLPEFERESHYHLQGKELLYRWFHSQGFTVEMEPYLTSIMQRPDLLVEFGQKRLAVEYQCSSISSSLFMKRTHSYWREGLRVIWILGGNQFKRQAAHWLQLSSFQALCMQYDVQPYLLYFCPESALFLRCSPLIPFSPATVFSHITSHPLSSSKMATIFIPTSLSLVHLQREWNQKKKHWRRNGLYALYQQNYKLLSYLYEKGIPPSRFPSEAAVPLPSLFAIHTSALIWQCYILIEGIGKLEVGDYFSSQQLYLQLIRNNRMKIRMLPYLSSSFSKQALSEYLTFLCLAGHIEQIDVYKYRKRQTFYIPLNEDDAYQRDEVAIHHALQLFPKQRTTLETQKRI